MYVSYLCLTNFDMGDIKRPGDFELEDEYQEELVEQAGNVLQAMFDTLERNSINFRVFSVEDFSEGAGVLRINFSISYTVTGAVPMEGYFEKSIADSFQSFGSPVYFDPASGMFSLFVSSKYLDEHKDGNGEPLPAMFDTINILPGLRR